MSNFQFSWNPLNMIPDSINYNLKVVLVSLIVVQFLAFVIWMIILVREYIQLRSDKENELLKEIVETSSRSDVVGSKTKDSKKKAN